MQSNIAIENHPLLHDFPTKASIYMGFPIATFDNRRVVPIGTFFSWSSSQACTLANVFCHESMNGRYTSFCRESCFWQCYSDLWFTGFSRLTPCAHPTKKCVAWRTTELVRWMVSCSCWSRHFEGASLANAGDRLWEWCVPQVQTIMAERFANFERRVESREYTWEVKR